MTPSREVLELNCGCCALRNQTLCILLIQQNECRVRTTPDECRSFNSVLQLSRPLTSPHISAAATRPTERNTEGRHKERGRERVSDVKRQKETGDRQRGRWTERCDEEQETLRPLRWFQPVGYSQCLMQR